jgi:hypothetical protein
MQYEWITDPKTIDQNQKWFPKLDDILLQHIDISKTLCVSVNDFQLALIQGYLDPNIPNTWLVQRAYFADANSKYKRLWLRTPNYHYCWYKACKEIMLDHCVIKFDKTSSIKKTYGENTLSMFPQFYENISWWEEDKLAYVRFDLNE